MIWFAGVVSSRAGFHLSRYRELVPASVGPGRQVVAALRPAKMGAWYGFRVVTDPAHALKANVRSSTGTSVVTRTYRNTSRSRSIVTVGGGKLPRGRRRVMWFD